MYSASNLLVYSYGNRSGCRVSIAKEGDTSWQHLPKGCAQYSSPGRERFEQVTGRSLRRGDILANTGGSSSAYAYEPAILDQNSKLKKGKSDSAWGFQHTAIYVGKDEVVEGTREKAPDGYEHLVIHKDSIYDRFWFLSESGGGDGCAKAAEKLVGQKMYYSSIANNCRHFTSLCSKGIYESGHLFESLSFLGLGAGSTDRERYNNNTRRWVDDTGERLAKEVRAERSRCKP